MNSNKKRVVVLGNGFTKAFIPEMPLVKDGFNVKILMDQLNENYSPGAFNVLNGAIQRDTDQKWCKVTDFEMLMTRLDNLMPYDFRHKVIQELDLLYHKLKELFVNQIKNAIEEGLKSTRGELPDLVKRLANHCIMQKIHCVTFNYDDVLDRALLEASNSIKTSPHSSSHWHPDGGYGFYCRTAYSLIELTSSQNMDITAMYLLKLHGSINWQIKLGASEIVGPEDVFHKADWVPPPDKLQRLRQPKVLNELVKNHLKPQSFMVLPVLMKGDLKTQPIFRLIWGLAYEKLRQAEEVFFVGYSLPITDIASRFLFKEALSHQPNVCVVNMATKNNSEESIKLTYKEVFPWIPDQNFNFKGAESWCAEFIE